ncbi:dihydroorotase [Candidatus Koribacter versatilis Ellin345]|uniref:Dihydroorotase n=1 Tax=Koribacter versatilis (strain Ellin345) TaxID=204669 RepID=Q1IJ01_KORVE|nr:dihydroorotase [Candidatus Koribacter versatilis]ABF43149.1 dihydroorotase [Candidatus Koribacter versatilis Ellin345]
MTSTSVLIRRGHVIDPANNIDRPMDVLLREGRVAAITEPGGIKSEYEEEFDANHLVVAPGFIDLHVHLREPGQAHKETIASGTRSAAAGGFTSVCAMPNTSPVNDTPETTTWMLQPDRGAVVNVFPIAAATIGSNGEKLTNFRDLQRAGAVAISDDGKPILDDNLMREALRTAARLEMPVVQHAEDPRMHPGGCMNYGVTSLRLGLRGIPNASEASVVLRDIRLTRESRAHLHVAHISTAEALDAVRRAKKENLRVTAEVTPHHFTLLDENIGHYDTAYKMNPPLRANPDRDAMIAGLKDGTLDCIATDHAPHAYHEKEQEFDRAPFGIIGLETALPLAITVLHKHFEIPLTRIVQLMSTSPARLFQLMHRGSLAVGSHADVVVFDPKMKWKFEAAKGHSKSKNTPFDGWDFMGKVMATIVGGRPVYLA